MPDYDVIVIGGGLGGVSAGALLAKQGRKVLLLEQSGRIGGCCSTFEKDGFHFDVGASIVEIIQPIEKVFKLLGTTFQQEVDLIACDPMMSYIFENGRRITYPLSAEKTGQIIASISPEDGRRWLGDLTVSRAYYSFYRRFDAQGRIQFTGDFMDPELDIKATYSGTRAVRDTAAGGGDERIVVTVDGAEPQRGTGGHADGLPPGNLRPVEIGTERRAGEADQGVAVEAQGGPGDRQLETRGGGVVAEQPVAEPERQVVHRPGRRHADVPVADAPGVVLHRGLGARREHVDRARVVAEVVQVPGGLLAAAEHPAGDDLTHVREVGLDARDGRAGQRRLQCAQRGGPIRAAHDDLGEHGVVEGGHLDAGLDRVYTRLNLARLEEVKKLEKKIRPLKPGESFVFSSPVKPGLGSYEVCATIDPKNAISEADENNNKACFTLVGK